jgi:hypothetical protein
MEKVAELRAAFIRSQLNRLMTEDDPYKRESAIIEFQRYLDWWGDSLSEQDRRAFAEQLLRLKRINPLPVR